MPPKTEVPPPETIIHEPVPPKTEVPPPETIIHEPVPPKTEVPPPETIIHEPFWAENVSEEAIAIMNATETRIVKDYIGFTEGEYNAIQGVKVGKLLEEIPSRDEAVEIWRSDRSMDIDLPHHGIYGVGEFNRHIKLAEFVRLFEIDSATKEMTIQEFLRTRTLNR